jgi:hypothetical protein
MLIHHSAEEYGAAAKRAADWATNKLVAIIDSGRQKAIDTIQTVQRMQPKDYVVPAQGLKFNVEEGQLKAHFGKNGEAKHFHFHNHALEQVGERCDMPNPRRMMEWLQEGEHGAKDLAQVLNHKYSQLPNDKRFLVRAVNDTEIRGFLSDRFRRLDSAPIVESFIQRVTTHGAVPIEGRALDTKFFLKVVLPYVLEPLPGEVMLWGAILKNSDFGDGKLEISGFVHRLRCTNLAMGEDGFAKIHLGGKLDDNIEFSQRTYELDTATTASAVQDVVDAVFEPVNVKKRMEVIQVLAKENTDADAVIKALRTKSKLNKTEAEEVAKLFSSADIEMLPPGQNTWRLSNAISLLAQNVEPGRQLELEELAGEVAGLRKVA